MNITEPLPARDTRGTEIQGIVMDTLRYKSDLHLIIGDAIVDFGAVAGTNITLGMVYYANWRVAGIGWKCAVENFTDGEDPEMTFGSGPDPDLFGKLKTTYPAAEKMVINDVSSYDKMVPRMLSSKLAEAETETTFTPGSPDGSVIWQTKPSYILVENTAQLTTGKAYPFVLIEVNRV